MVSTMQDEGSATTLGSPTVLRIENSKTGGGEDEKMKEVEDAAEKEEEAPPKGGLINADGSINWDCPCLQGMAHGPCGEEFKDSFSCFQSSTAEPVGFDCVDKFTSMQKCFKQYPDIYNRYLDDEPPADEEIEAEEGETAEEKTLNGSEEVDVIIDNAVDELNVEK